MHECCSTSSQQWQKTQLPKQSPSSTFVTRRAVKDVLAQLNTRVCGWALCLAAASASAWCYRLEFLSSRGTRDSDCLDWAFLHFKDTYSETFRAALKAGESNCHSSTTPLPSQKY